jgi:hypothetical protein
MAEATAPPGLTAAPWESAPRGGRARPGATGTPRLAARQEPEGFVDGAAERRTRTAVKQLALAVAEQLV